GLARRRAGRSAASSPRPVCRAGAPARPAVQLAVQFTMVSLTGVAYRAQQASMFVPALVAQRVLRTIAREPPPPVSADVARAIRRRYATLLDRDLANVEAGMYPRELLFQVPMVRYAQAFPFLALDVPRSILRKKRRDFRDIPDVDRERFPAYFRRTFHWQTD